jgi:hypothetical protein
MRMESKNSFVIPKLVCLATSELVTEFILEFYGFHVMPNLNSV